MNNNFHMDKQIWDQVAISFEQSTFDENKGPIQIINTKLKELHGILYNEMGN